jgi:hypothetical protein
MTVENSDTGQFGEINVVSGRTGNFFPRQRYLTAGEDASRRDVFTSAASGQGHYRPDQQLKKKKKI